MVCRFESFKKVFYLNYCKKRSVGILIALSILHFGRIPLCNTPGVDVLAVEAPHNAIGTVISDFIIYTRESLETLPRYNPKRRVGQAGGASPLRS